MAIPSPCRVLVVDDHPDTAESLARLLQSDGHDAIFLTDATQAEEVVRSFQPHLVLLDIAMPHMDGWTLGKRLRAQDGGADLKLVAVTAFAHADAYASSRRAGFDAHVAKPVDPRMVAALLEQCFAEPRLPRPS